MNKIIIVSGPVVVEDNKVLLNKSGNDNFWKFCGGRVRDNENLIDTAKRRVQEEMGINIKILNKKPFIIHVKKEINGAEADVILAHFLAERVGDIKAGIDVREWNWFDKDNLPDDLGKNIIPALKHFKFVI